MDREILAVKRFFESHQILLSDIWLESCISWCKTQNSSSNTPRPLENDIYEQWLLLDLRDVNIPTLPPNLSARSHSVLNENFSLQVMQIVDISKPKHWQLQQIRNANVLTRADQKDPDVIGTGKRMLQLTMTDGVQEVEAFEYRPISCLNLNMPPGFKIRIIAPVTVRRGRLMLEERNVKVLGGEVEELAIDNAAENVLARCLNLPQNPNPLVIEENLLNAEEREVSEQIPNGWNCDNKALKSNTCVSKVNSRSNISEEEEKLIQEEIDFMLEAEESISTTNFTEEMRTDNTRRDAIDPHVDNLNNSDENITGSLQKIKPREGLNLVTSQEGRFKNTDNHPKRVDDSLKNLQPLKPNILTISKLLNNRSNISRGLFKIKAKFKSIVEKLTVDADEYKLVMKVVDDTGEIDVQLHTDVITDFVGYRPSVLLSLKNRILENDEEAAGIVMKALEAVRDKLLKLDNILEVRIIKDEEVPTILRIF